MEPLASKQLLDKNDIAGIFSNIQEIRAVNSALLQQLEQSPNLSAQTVGEIFTKMVRERNGEVGGGRNTNTNGTISVCIF
jgi:hypothetical protein